MLWSLGLENFTVVLSFIIRRACRTFFGFCYCPYLSIYTIISKRSLLKWSYTYRHKTEMLSFLPYWSFFRWLHEFVILSKSTVMEKIMRKENWPNKENFSFSPFLLSWWGWEFVTMSNSCQNGHVIICHRKRKISMVL